LTFLELLQNAQVIMFLSQLLGTVDVVSQKALNGDVEAARLLCELAGCLPYNKKGIDANAEIKELFDKTFGKTEQKRDDENSRGKTQ